MNIRGIQFTESEYDIHLTIFKRLGRGWSDAVQHGCIIRIDAVCGEDLGGHADGEA